MCGARERIAASASNLDSAPAWASCGGSGARVCPPRVERGSFTKRNEERFAEHIIDGVNANAPADIPTDGARVAFEYFGEDPRVLHRSFDDVAVCAHT